MIGAFFLFLSLDIINFFVDAHFLCHL